MEPIELIITLIVAVCMVGIIDILAKRWWGR